MALALPRLAQPALQLIEAALALGPQTTVRAVAELLHADDDDTRRGLDEALASLAAHGLLWQDAAGRLHPVAGAREIWTTPLGLDQPVRELLARHSAEDLRRVMLRLGLRTGRTKADNLTAIAAYFADADTVRALVDAAPRRTRELLERHALEGPGVGEPPAGILLISPREDGGPADWAAERGLLVRDNPWFGAPRMPREVSVALRGPDYRPPFTPRPPEPPTAPVSAERVTAEASAAAIGIAEQATAVLDACAAAPPAVLKSGGVGVRELRRVAAAAGTEPEAARLALELAWSAGLVAVEGSSVPVTAAFDVWRAGEPADRLAVLLRAWWDLGHVPTAAVDDAGKALPALQHRRVCELCRRARHGLVETVAALPDGRGAAGLDGLVPAVVWRTPLVDLPAQDADAPFATVWREAERLGVIALGAATGLAWALLTGDEETLLARAGELLPRAETTARFGADLTAVVTGSPSAQLAALLDSAADREVRGTASVWRFSPASVRRALDAGASAASLEGELAAAATGGLPQPLRYLLADVGRRHGHMTVTPALCCIRSDDAALLAEVAAHRRLAGLSPRLLAPTVLAVAKPPAETLAALRAAGYLPVAEGADGTARLERLPRTRAGAPKAARGGPGSPFGMPPGPPAPDADALAARLLSVPAAADVHERLSQTERLVTQFAGALDEDEVRQLAHAVDEGLAVRIEYVASNGSRTTRTVSDLVVEGAYLAGWCHLRKAERIFALSRVCAVMAVS